MKRTSIGLRLALWYAGLLAAALAFFSVLAVWQLRRVVFLGADSELEQAVSGAERVLRENSGHMAELTEEMGEYADELKPAITLDVLANDRPLTRVPQHSAPLPESRTLERTFDIAGTEYHVRARVSLQPGLALSRDFTRAVAVFSPLLLVFACIAGYWISRRALRPVDAITEAARSIGMENLSRRLGVPRAHDELRRLSEAWNEMLARLEESVRRLSRFTADASHEMRSPLAVIRTTAELALRRERDTGEYRAALEQIHRQTVSLTSLIEDLLVLARAEQDPHGPVSAVDLSSAVREACALLGPMAEQRGIRLNTEFEDGNIAVPGHAESIQRLVAILLDNAIKYSPENDEVVVRVRHGGTAGASIEVTDNGGGIAAEDLPHIFERFYRADRVRTPGTAGAGLGLSLAQSITHAHGAGIQVETAIGNGSTFRVSFPACKASPEKEPVSLLPVSQRR